MLSIVQASKRTLTTAVRRSSKAASLCSFQSPISVQQRGVKTLKFADTTEVVYERADYPASKLATIFAKDTMAIIGYGTQGMAQSLNMRDNKLKVVIGVRKDGTSWKDAMKDGWIPGKTLFSIEEACKKGTIIMNLLSDAGQKGISDCDSNFILDAWPMMKPLITKGKTLYFSHGFGVVFHEDTGIVPPTDVDVILAAPKGTLPQIN